jgi:surfactin synthase thioesterase subunit
MTPYLDRLPGESGIPRLFCFHHAGGGASVFAGWRAALAPHLDVFPVQLPGREGRVSSPPVRDLDALVGELDVHLGPFLREPFLFYGHSMGAIVAYRLAYRRFETGQSLVGSLVVGAYPPPDREPPLGDAGVVALRGEVAGRLGRFPRWVRAATALLEHDIALVDSHRPVLRGPLPVPVHVLTGSVDPLMSPTDAWGWGRHTSAGCRVHVVPGGHLFHRDSPDVVLELLLRVGMVDPELTAAVLFTSGKSALR